MVVAPCEVKKSNARLPTEPEDPVILLCWRIHNVIAKPFDTVHLNLPLQYLTLAQLSLYLSSLCRKRIMAEIIGFR
jgi:hypothetical protein